MRVTRRELFKGALAASALALVPSLPRLPGAGSARARAARDIWHVPFFRGSLMKMDNYGISSARVSQRIDELLDETSADQAFMQAVLEEVREEWYCVCCDRLFPNRIMAKAGQSDGEDGVFLCPACYSEAQAYLDLAAQLLGN